MQLEQVLDPARFRATEAELEAMRGMILANGAVELLTAPKWDGARYVALARVGNALCNIEVSIKPKGMVS